MSTPMGKVNRFYDFWFNFQSWRDFSHEDEYDASEAETREEKRWIERRNAKLRMKKSAEENKRVLKLVELAYKLDPRIVKQKEDEKKKRMEEQVKRNELIRKKERRRGKKKKKKKEKD